MVERWVGLVASGDKVIMIDAEVPDHGRISIQADQTFKLQSGSREAAYRSLFHQISDYLRENRVSRAIVKASAVAKGGGLSHLQSAELRGVVMAAAADACDTESLAKAQVSKKFGTKKADEYIADVEFWDENIKGELRSGSREAALLIIATRDS